MRRYSIGLDYGTDSARAVVLDVDTGLETFSISAPYPHGVMDKSLPNGQPLPPLWALQHPRDYLDLCEELLSAAAASIEYSGEVVGLGVDFTSCTILPVDTHGVPLAFDPRFASNAHAYVKLWKHHAAAPYAARINASGAYFLQNYDGRTSEEWSLAKAWETLDQSPEVWDATQWWMEAGDWLVWQLVGDQVRSQSHATLKTHYQRTHGGYPSSESLKKISAALPSWLDKQTKPLPVGSSAGGLAPGWAQRTGLRSGTPVAVSVMDAHAAVPGLDVTSPGTLVVVLGTSTCHITLSRESRPHRGIESVGDGAALEGYYDYFTGQAATGDMIRWLLRVCGARSQPEESAQLRAFNHELLTSQGPGTVRVMDWWNGCRTPLGNPDLKGKIEGLTLGTTPSEIYRAMLEASAFGTRAALETVNSVVPGITNVRTTGSIAQEPAIMQIYADVLDVEIEASETKNGSGRGAAVYGAMAAGIIVPKSAKFRTYVPTERARQYRDGYAQYEAEINLARFPTDVPASL